MKVMKNRMCHGLMLSFLLLASAGYAHTESETNAVAKSMLEFVLLSVNDNLDDIDQKKLISKIEIANRFGENFF